MPRDGNPCAPHRPPPASTRPPASTCGFHPRRKNCKGSDSPLRLGSCNHCGAKGWNILGDADTGYVLSEDGGKNCLQRDGEKAKVGSCEDGYALLTLQFTTSEDLEAMSSPGARMITAASDGDERAVKKYLKEDVDVNARDWDNLTALIAASSSGHLRICKLLLKEGADVNASDKDKITALMEAAIMDHKDIVKLLLQSGAEMEAKSETGVTAMWLAASQGRFELVKQFLDKGADANNVRSDGITALMGAAAGGHTKTVEVLVKKGADVNAKDQVSAGTARRRAAARRLHARPRRRRKITLQYTKICSEQPLRRKA